MLFAAGSPGSPEPLVFSRQLPNHLTSSAIVLADSSSDISRSLSAGGYRFSHRFACFLHANAPAGLSANEDCHIVNGLEISPSFSIRATVYKSFASRMAAMGWPGWIEIFCGSHRGIDFPLKIGRRNYRRNPPRFPSRSAGGIQPQAHSAGDAPKWRNTGLHQVAAYRDGQCQNTRRSGDARAPQRDPGLARAFLLYFTHPNGVMVICSFHRRLWATRVRRSYEFPRSSLERDDSAHSESNPALTGPRSFPGDQCREQRLGPKWNALAEDALRAAAQELSATNVRCGLGHGDFTPWNTRLRGGILCLVDWEMASWGAPILLDTFQFRVQTNLCCGRGMARKVSADFNSQKRAL